MATNEDSVAGAQAADIKAVGVKTANAQSTSGDSIAAQSVTFPIKSESIKDVDPEVLRRRGIDSETHERKAVTYKGLIEEFGKPKGPRLYNAIAVAAFGGVQPWRPALSIITLEDQWISPRTNDESDEDFAKRLKRHGELRAKVQKLLADAEGGVE